MSTKLNILVLGATGYIGGSVLSQLLNRDDIKSLNITALVRSAEKAEKLRNLGVNAVIGSHFDLPLVEKLAKESEVVFSMASADDLEAIQALLKGLKSQFEDTGKVPIFIHTSGAGVAITPAEGTSDQNAIIYDDADSKQMTSIPRTQIHRQVDLEIVAADEAGYVKTFIVMPGTIFGVAKTKLTELGVQNRFSYPVATIIRISLARGKPAVVGEGKNVWPFVSIEDTSDFYLKLYDSVLKDPHIGHGVQGYYFAENGEFKFSVVAKKIGEALVELGKATTPDPVPLSKDELMNYFKGSMLFGSNCRCRGNRSRSLGWTPKDGLDDFLAGIKAEVEALATSG
ncbi:NAD(P)-binding protein [Cyathus striatus]|nr:NAD(P)-binding protein [Cyathus striatus]